MTFKDCINTIDSKKYTDSKLESYPTKTEINTTLESYPTITQMNTAIETAISQIPTGSGSTIHKITFESVNQFNSLLPDFYDSENEIFTKDVIIVSGLSEESFEYWYYPKGSMMVNGSAGILQYTHIQASDVGTSDYQLQFRIFRFMDGDFFFNDQTTITAYISTCYIGSSSSSTVQIPRNLFPIFYIDGVVEHGSLTNESDENVNDGDNGR